MPKLDKSKYTKKQWKLIKEYRKKKKESERLEKEETLEKKSIEQKTEYAKKAAEIKIEETLQKDNSEIVNDHNKKIAFVLGNGTSRSSINPYELQKFGKIYGCNALYRTFNPDFLIAVDTKMIIEINKSGYQKNNEVWTNPNKQYTKFKGFNYFNPSKGWSSGPTALWLASEHKHEVIYILGFDYRGLHDGQKFNNVYADSPNYKKSTDSATFFGNWMRQTTSVINSNPKTKYIRVIAEDGYIPKDLAKFKNIEHISVETFKKILEIS